MSALTPVLEFDNGLEKVYFKEVHNTTAPTRFAMYSQQLGFSPIYILSLCWMDWITQL